MKTPALNEALNALLAYGESPLAERVRVEVETLFRVTVNEALEEAASAATKGRQYTPVAFDIAYDIRALKKEG